MRTRWLTFAFMGLSLGCFHIALATPAIEVVPPSAEWREKGEDCDHMVFTDIPQERKLSLFTKRLCQKNPDEWNCVGSLWIDRDNNVIVDGKIVTFYGLLPLGYMPGEKVSYCLRLKDGTTLAQTSYFPRPLIKTSKAGNVSIKAELLIWNIPATYMLEIQGLNEGEIFTLLSVSGHERISKKIAYSSNSPILYMPGVIGAAGGEGWVKVIRESGEFVLMRLPWGDALFKPLLVELQNKIEAPAFKRYSP